MEYLKDLFFQLHSIVLSLESFEIRAAVTYLLSEGRGATCNSNNAVIYSSIFEYLLRSYIKFISNNADLAEEHDGYMIKTVSDIKRCTFASVYAIRNALKVLDEVGLIVCDKGGVNNSTRLRISDLASQIIYDNYYLYTQYRDESLLEISEKREKQKEIKKDNYKRYLELLENKKNSNSVVKKTKDKSNNDCLDFDKMNEAQFDRGAIQEVFKVVSDDKERLASCYLVYLYSYYYRLYTGNTFEWDRKKYETLLGAFREYCTYDNMEICVSLTLRKVLNIKETDLGGKRNKEKIFSEKFNHDYRKDHLCNYYADLYGYQGFRFDNILNNAEYEPAHYEEQKPSLVIEMNEPMPKRLSMFF